jgi:hypothetical protein
MTDSPKPRVGFTCGFVIPLQAQASPGNGAFLLFVFSPRRILVGRVQAFASTLSNPDGVISDEVVGTPCGTIG